MNGSRSDSVHPGISPPPNPSSTRARRGWRRWRWPAVLALVWGLLLSIDSATSTGAWLLRTCLIVGLAVLAYAVLEKHPATPPLRLARWVMQLLGVVAAVLVGAFVAYAITSDWPFWQERLRLQGWLIVSFMGVLFGPWIALAAMVGQREAFAREQALSFALERSELERAAADARLHLLQAQVQPHFLFNTLANVRALVSAGSPQAPQVLDSLISYLRAAVPRLGQAQPTLADELQLVRAYLALMHMRMPDRLRYTVHADDDTAALPCPPMALLTLVENAVRHGIDPSEVGGAIDVRAQRLGSRCLLRVADTGVGLQATGQSVGTGLSTLRERLRLAHGEQAQLRLSAVQPHGVCAEIEYPLPPA